MVCRGLGPRKYWWTEIAVIAPSSKPATNLVCGVGEWLAIAW